MSDLEDKRVALNLKKNERAVQKVGEFFDKRAFLMGKVSKKTMKHLHTYYVWGFQAGWDEAVQYSNSLEYGTDNQPQTNWKLSTHVKGKAYSLTQKNMCAMIADIEKLKKELREGQLCMGCKNRASVGFCWPCHRHYHNLENSCVEFLKDLADDWDRDYKDLNADGLRQVIKFYQSKAKEALKELGYE